MNDRYPRGLGRSLLEVIGWGGVASVVIYSILAWSGHKGLLAIGAYFNAAVCYGIIAFYFDRLVVVFMGSVIFSLCVSLTIWLQVRPSSRAFLTTHELVNYVKLSWVPAIMLTSTVGVIGFGLGDRRRKVCASRANLCGNCGYSHVGLATDLCPECGKPWPQTPSTAT